MLSKMADETVDCLVLVSPLSFGENCDISINIRRTNVFVLVFAMKTKVKKQFMRRTKHSPWVYVMLKMSRGKSVARTLDLNAEGLTKEAELTMPA